MRLNQTPYDLVAIGGGTAGLVAAFGAAGLGARVALVERDRLGGDCLNVGCVPSKALLRSARAAREIHVAPPVGVRAGKPAADFAAVMARIKERRAILAPNDSIERLVAAGVDVYLGEATFTSRSEIEVRVTASSPNGETVRRIRFRRAVIATGSRPTVPSVPGLADAGYFTNENIFDIAEQPQQLFVIGAGPIGCELAQAFALLGTSVTLSDVADRPLPREDADASAIVRRALEHAGVNFRLGAPLESVPLAGHAAGENKHTGGPAKSPNARTVILVAAGRTPNVEGLNLEAAGVRWDEHGVEVNDRLRPPIRMSLPLAILRRRISSRTRPTRPPALLCRTRSSLDAGTSQRSLCPGAPIRCRKLPAWVTSTLRPSRSQCRTSTGQYWTVRPMDSSGCITIAAGSADAPSWRHTQES
jgi:pyruvate/2-oxoglutarate dehydrogenase complex dihydrolipoamide dehydrogenase (E3) component